MLYIFLEKGQPCMAVESLSKLYDGHNKSRLPMLKVDFTIIITITKIDGILAENLICFHYLLQQIHVY